MFVELTMPHSPDGTADVEHGDSPFRPPESFARQARDKGIVGRFASTAADQGGSGKSQPLRDFGPEERSKSCAVLTCSAVQDVSNVFKCSDVVVLSGVAGSLLDEANQASQRLGKSQGDVVVRHVGDTNCGVARSGRSWYGHLRSRGEHPSLLATPLPLTRLWRRIQSNLNLPAYARLRERSSARECARLEPRICICR